MNKKFSRRRVQELKYPSSAYASQDRIKSQINDSLKEHLSKANLKPLKHEFSYLQQGAEQITFLSAHPAELEQFLMQLEMQEVADFIRAICTSSLQYQDACFFFSGDVDLLCDICSELNQLFSKLTKTARYSSHQHLSIEMSGAIEALAEDKTNTTAKKAVFDILVIMISRVMK